MIFRQWVSGIQPADDGGEHRADSEELVSETPGRSLPPWTSSPGLWGHSEAWPGCRRGSQEMDRELTGADGGAPLYPPGSDDACAQPGLGVSEGSDGNSQESRDPAAPPSLGVAAAAEALSAPRKWPKGSGPGPFKRQPRPLAPRPRPREARAALAEAGGWRRVSDARDWADWLDWQTLAGRGDSGTSPRMWPRPPRRPYRCARPHVCNSAGLEPLTPPLRARGPAGPAREQRPSQRLPRGIPEGAGAEPPHSGDAFQPGWPGRALSAAAAGPESPRAGPTSRQDWAGHVAQAQEPPPRNARRSGRGRSCRLAPWSRPLLDSRSQTPSRSPHPGSLSAQHPTGPKVAPKK